VCMHACVCGIMSRVIMSEAADMHTSLGTPCEGRIQNPHPSHTLHARHIIRKAGYPIRKAGYPCVCVHACVRVCVISRVMSEAVDMHTSLGTPCGGRMPTPHPSHTPHVLGDN